MKLNKHFVLNQICDSTVLVPYGDEALSFNSVITLNETALFLYNQVEEDIDVKKLEEAIQKEYGVDEPTSKKAVKIFVEQMKEAGCIE